jgi:ABC-type transport system involved in multi-copper enzyme maturation permease subunit
MKELARASWILFQAHLWRIFRTRRALVAGGLTLLPVLLAAAVHFISREEGSAPPELLGSFVLFVMLQTIVPLVSLVMASAVVAEEIEDRTITYLFTRPMPRAAILLGRWAAAALPIAALLCLSSELIVRLLGETGKVGETKAWMPEGFHFRILVAVMMGGVVYSALFAAAGALFKRPMLVGLGYTFVYEGFLGNLPGSTQKGTVVYYLKSYLLEPHPNLFGDLSEELFQTPPIAPSAAVFKLGVILVVGLGLAAWSFSKREYVLAA